MKTICIDSFGDIDVLQEKEIEKPRPGRGEVRISIKATGFNPVDVKMRQGFMPSLPFPLVLGVDFSGIVEAKGDHVHDLEVGDEVYGLAFGPNSNGSYSDSLCTSSYLVAKKPKNLSFEEAAAVPVTYVTAFQALVSKGALQKNRPLFMSGGSGGVGSAALSLSKIYEAGPVFTMAGSEESARYLMETFDILNDHILRYKGLSQEEMVRKIIEMNKGERFYFVLDFVGGKVKDLCFEVVDYWGHLATPVPETDDYHVSVWGRNPDNYVWVKSLSVHMVYIIAAALGNDEKSWNVYTTQLNHLTRLFEKEGLIKPQIEVVGDFSLKTVKEAHQRLEDAHVKGKLVMSHSKEQ